MTATRVAFCAFACLLLAAGAHAYNFTLPPLPYATEVFEPSIDNYTMFLHWNRHANAFVGNLNNVLVANCSSLRRVPLLTLNERVGATKACTSAELKIPGLSITIGGVKRCPVLPANCATVVRNNAGGLWNHGLFFQHNLAPARTQTFSKDASAALKAAVQRDFGSQGVMRMKFQAAATSVFGSGWAWVIVDPQTKRLKITVTGNQDNPLMTLPTPSSGAPVTTKGLPILGIDVWEHAYYLKYVNVRASYVTNFWNVINWKGVSDLFEAAVAGKYASIDVLKPAANWA